jgi:hypothetical protein
MRREAKAPNATGYGHYNSFSKAAVTARKWSSRVALLRLTACADTSEPSIRCGEATEHIHHTVDDYSDQPNRYHDRRHQATKPRKSP